MPQETNLNISPYFDDFDENKNYYKVLFKPGYPVQARELTTVQSILQNQIERFGDHVFKEGSKVISGDTFFNSNYSAVELNNNYLGIDVSSYIKSLIGKKIKGENSGIIAEVTNALTSSESERNNATLYVDYITSSPNDNETLVFLDGETLLLEENLVTSSIFFNAGESIASLLPLNATSFASSFEVTSGVYYLRGHFVNVKKQLIILDQYTNTPDYRIGFTIVEDLVTLDQDQTLSDNAKGFNNYAAPGADRLKISAILDKKNLLDETSDKFVEIARIQNGIVRNTPNDPLYNVINDRFAKRTYEESGDYYVKRFQVSCKESLNNFLGNNGIFTEDRLTYQGNVPSEDLATYQISPGKAYVRGYDVEVNAPTFIDVEKPRTTKETELQSISYSTGKSLRLNRVTGCPTIGIGNGYTVSLRNSRIESNSSSAAGTEIGVARVFDFALEEGSYNTSVPDSNNWDISLYDVQTYTKITLNQPITLTIPTYVVGNSSGATGYLTSAVNNSTNLSLYNVNGKFLEDESFTFDGVRNSRTATSVRQYGISDIKSIYSNQGNGVFNADVNANTTYFIGISSISAETLGSSVVTIPGTDYLNLIQVDNVFQYTNPDVPNIISSAKVTQVSSNTISTLVTISAVTSVAGVCNGDLPTSPINVTDLSVTGINLLSTSGGLYSKLPKRNVSSVDLTESELIIRKQYELDINLNTTEIITAAENEFFLPYDEERYILSYSDGTIEPLSEDKIVINEDGSQFNIVGLTVGSDTGANLVATLRKINVKPKLKRKNRSASLIVDKSTLRTSGIGTTTKNDGLEYDNYPYGVRVQDNEISLNVPDVIQIYGIFESLDIADPSSPIMTLSSILSPNSNTSDIILGEELIGSTNNSIAVCVERKNSNQIGFIYKNDSQFSDGEVVTFKESGVTAIVSSISSPSRNITKMFTLDNGIKETYYDYSKIIRKKDSLPPQKKIIIYFEHGYYNSDDDGDITTVNSYQEYNYSYELPVHNGIRASDIIDIRPRVSNYVVSKNKRSPFEFYGREFTQQGNSSTNILASDESITLKYKFYLPRIDRIFINKNGEFVLQKGTPDENPKLPTAIDDALEIAKITLPPYLYVTENALVTSYDYKRYQMSDISKLETRIKNLEYYTTLSLLEVETTNLFIPDSSGLNRFKSGFFVDNFSSRSTQLPQIDAKNSIDPKKNTLRPSHYTNSIDLSVATVSEDSSNIDIKNISASEILGTNIQKSGDIITLKYTNVEFIKQPYATRVENVHPFTLTFWQGTVQLNPSSDIWVDTVSIDPVTTTIDNYTSVLSELNINPQTGLGPEVWGSWATTGFGETRLVDARLQSKGGTAESEAVRIAFQNSSIPQADRTWIMGGRQALGEGLQPTTGVYVEVQDTIQTRTGTQLSVTESVSTESLGTFVVSNELQTYMRSRNIEFRGSDFRPNTRMYAFFDGINVTGYCFPKLIQVNMQSGTFGVGETVDIRLQTNSSVRGSFRVCNINHKAGRFNSPTEVYTEDPFTNQPLGTSYNSSSSILNVDTSSLSTMEESNYYGLLRQNYLLVGRTSGATAIVTNTNIIADNGGDIIGSFFIPNPNQSSNPRFENGIKTFRLSSVSDDNYIPGTPASAGETIYFASGSTVTTQEQFLSVRSANVVTNVLTEQRVTSDFTGRYTDPLAQSFACDEPTGVFLTKVDLYFQAKDNILPVSCQIRTMDLGTPTQTVLPFSHVTLPPSKVKISNDASIPTTFEFESPVYIEGDQEYALVVLSNSNAYYAWISSLLGRDPDGDDESGAFRIPTDTLTGEIITSQPTLGSLFKSQNASTWTPSQYEDLKFTLYRADFDTSPSNINFYNPPLSVGNDQIPLLANNPLDFDSRKIKLTLSEPITESDSTFVFGTTVIQSSTGAFGNYVSKSGTVSTLSIDSSGFGYEDGTYNDVVLSNVTGTGTGLKVDITVSGNEVSSVSVGSASGYGYEPGDVLSVGGLGTNNLGTNARISVASLSNYSTIVLEDCQGTFNEGVGVGNSLTFANTSNNYVYLNGGDVTIESPIEVISDGLHIKVNHLNHGMHSPLNYVKLSDVDADTPSSNTQSAINAQFTGGLSVTNIQNFEEFEGLPVSPANPGYAIINNEIIQYTSVNSQITITERGIDGTIAVSHENNSIIRKYELNGISLLRINKEHRLEDATVSNPIGLDYYTIKIDQSAIGDLITDRTTSSLLSPMTLYCREDKFDGGSLIRATQNMQFEVLTPLVQNFTPSGTNISAEARTVSAKSISGDEIPFADRGYSSINLGTLNYFDTPRLIASKVNETRLLSELPRSKSFNMLVNLVSQDSRLSPCIDLSKTSIITTSNRVNEIVSSENYPIDNRINSVDDPNAFVYISKQIRLQNSASSLKLYVTADINPYCDIRALYFIGDTENNNPIFQLFPGYNNLDNLIQTVDPKLSDGRPDSFTDTNDDFNFETNSFVEYEFTANNLTPFKVYSIKLIMTSTNQSYVPELKDIRAIALA
jgi:hypothetical protein